MKRPRSNSSPVSESASLAARADSASLRSGRVRQCIVAPDCDTPFTYKHRLLARSSRPLKIRRGSRLAARSSMKYSVLNSPTVKCGLQRTSLTRSSKYLIRTIISVSSAIGAHPHTAALAVAELCELPRCELSARGAEVVSLDVDVAVADSLEAAGCSGPPFVPAVLP